ncbi:auxin response factor, DNA-binding pseudobarrel domain protein [Artemisia annua]|uniref:Auxin response factor, DNA-binding pseudobarrel domain protein n=1 Tax=Artemisia annua TaxID=35608 RepID=A0A2U1MLT6_ARTAN|nr:auxin response factor, DNA-binding pseudobarrel domain protein [Artemisia annua]
MGSSSENIGNDQADLSHQLWSECVSLTVKVPRIGDRVFYFPQGHLEQIVACMKEGSANNVPSYDLPSKIQCKVVDVQFKAVRGSEEVYAKITLLPDGEESEGSSSESIFENVHASSFCKVLTDSDVTIRGGCSLAKRHVADIFPPLDTTRYPMSQELVAKDLNGETWKLQHTYGGNAYRCNSYKFKAF